MENSFDIARYTKGFNAGYILYHYETPLAEKLQNIPPHTSFFEGFTEGIKQLQRVKHVTQEFEHIRTQSIDHSKNRSI